MADIGRPTKFRPEMVIQAEKLVKLGATDEQLADFFEVNPDTIHEWKKVHADFSESLKQAKAELDSKVEQSLYRRAVGYEHEDTYFSTYEGEVTATPTIKRYPPSEVACIFWLKNRKPSEWRDVQRLEHGGSINFTAETMSVEDLRLEMIKRGELSVDGRLLTNGLSQH